MKRMFWLLGAGLLATTVAFAQNLPSNSKDGTESNPNSTYQTANSLVRGCLSGSAGNYTLTDQNGMQYHILGDNAGLQGKAGHEVEITTRPNQSGETSNMGDQTASRAGNTVQVSGVHDVASSCNIGNSVGSPPPTDENSATPKRTPDAAEPPRPQMMAMLQQQSKPDEGTNAPTGSAAQQTTPPVTSQTPATATGLNGSRQPVGSSSPANNTGMTGSETNHAAQAARQGELNTNPQPGQTSGRGANNQGVNNSSTTSPKAVPASPNSATSSGTQQPQANANDQNKPLYERPATDIPWANQSGGNTGAPNPPH